jgi:long-subunit acyl-CoA synthetase (AMP-forming)
MFEKIYAAVHGDFTAESGEVTYALKVKRGVIDERYRKMIDAMYN